MSTEGPIVAGDRFGKPAQSLISPQSGNAVVAASTFDNRLVFGGGTLHFQPFERTPIEEILLRPQGKSLRPGGDSTTPKPFSLRSQRQIRYKKVGIRRVYNVKQIMSLRHFYKKFPLSVDSIANVFEEGLGEEIGQPRTEELQAEAMEEEKVPDTRRSQGRRVYRNSKIKQTSAGGSRASSSGQSGVTSDATTPTDTPKPKRRGWVPPSLREKRGLMMDPLEQLERGIRSILNKITLDTFDELAPRVVTFFEDEVTNAAGLYKLVSLIFEKTVQEPLFGPLYAGICVSLSNKEKKLQVTEKKSDGTEMTKHLGFKQALLQQCQKEFEKGKREVVVKSSMTKQDIEEAQMKQKRILIGTMQFIGQLYLVDLLTSKIIRQCVSRLLGQAPSEEDVECCCELLRNVGQKLDENAAEMIDMYYRRLENISKDKDGFQKRIRFMARNLLELRDRAWQDDVQKKELKKKQDIREEFEQEKGSFRRPNVTAFDETDPSQLATVLDSDVDIGIRFGIKKFDVDVIGVDATATERIRNEPGVGMKFNDRYGRSRQARLEPEQRIQKSTNRKQRHQSFLLKSQDISVSVVTTQTKRRRRPLPVYDRPGTDVVMEGEDKEEFETKIKSFFTNFVETGQASLGDTVKLISRLDEIDRPLLARIYFEQTADKMGEMRTRGTQLLFALLDQVVISAQEFAEGLNDFFEFFVDMELDNPNIFESVAFILAQMFDDGMIQMDQLHSWLSKDSQLDKWYRRRFDKDPQEMARKSEEASHGFKKIHLFLAKMIVELGKLNEDNNASAEIQSIMTEQRFELNQYVPQSRRNAFVREWELGDYLK